MGSSNNEDKIRFENEEIGKSIRYSLSQNKGILYEKIVNALETELANEWAQIAIKIAVKENLEEAIRQVAIDHSLQNAIA